MIQKLSDSLIAKIAAGEVIERPFSVVKELVENSLDAGAHHISIEVEDGGRRKLVIIDDGCGMSKEEALLSLERHATSKISTEQDLFQIKTLGFRGEALPSIAAVSQMTLETRSAHSSQLTAKPLTVSREPSAVSDLGTRIDVEGGKIIKVGSSPIVQGTRITISNLFFNTPARLKFLKSKQTEFSHIASWIESIALGRPEVGFQLFQEGKKELAVSSVTPQNLRQRVGEVLGVQVAEYLRPLSHERNGLKLMGFISDHRASGSSAKSLFLYVNGRIVRDRLLQHAILQAYENLLMKHHYPWVVLFLEVPSDLVDVNVHPTKNEVRFAQTNLVHEFVREGVRKVLGANQKVPGTFWSEQDPTKIFPRSPAELAQDYSAISLWSKASRQEIALSEGGAQTSPRSPDQNLGGSFKINMDGLKIIGQAHQTYLVCETGEKLILIDQHAAHERIGFEKLKKQYEEGEVQTQQLLIPQNFDLRPSQGEILKKYIDELKKVGLEVEFFGGNTFILRSIPVLLEGSDGVKLIEEILEDLQSFEKLTPLDEKVHEVLETMACHGQVRAGDRLDSEEIEALLAEMQRTPFGNQCPHGRPALLEIPFAEVEKWFKRRL